MKLASTASSPILISISLRACTLNSFFKIVQAATIPGYKDFSNCSIGIGLPNIWPW
jgi:hypothetical protein